MSELIITGDRVLIKPDDGDRQTKAGLYLPATVAEKERVGTGQIVKTGPGYIMPNPDYTDEPWAEPKSVIRYIPLQARPGDFAFYLRKDSVEITYQEEAYLIIPSHAILALIRADADDLLAGLPRSDEEDLH